jgi:hypothetical protein
VCSSLVGAENGKAGAECAEDSCFSPLSPGFALRRGRFGCRKADRACAFERLRLPGRMVHHLPSGVSLMVKSSPKLRRLAPNMLAAAGVALGSLLIGMAGYAWFEDMNGVDSFVSAAMILAGMGPIAAFKTDAGKIFAGCYALYSGLVVLISAGLVLAPVMHNVLHRFHLAAEGDET